MVKIIEIKETIFDSQLVDNIYAIDKTIKGIMNETDLVKMWSFESDIC